MATLLNKNRVPKSARGFVRKSDKRQWAIAAPHGASNKRLLDVQRFDFSVEMPELFVSKSNRKLNKTAEAFEIETGRKIQLFSFNLPALLACAMAGSCAHFCYALQGNYRFGNVQKPRAQNLAILKQLYLDGGIDLVADALTAMLQNMVDETPRVREPWIRIHDSGDFFKRWYFEAWNIALARVPEVHAYAYTKMIDFVEHVTAPNFNITQSVGGLADHRIDPALSHARVFASNEERIAAGYVDGSDTDIPAMMNQQKIGLVYHGSEGLKAAA